MDDYARNHYERQLTGYLSLGHDIYPFLPTIPPLHSTYYPMTGKPPFSNHPTMTTCTVNIAPSLEDRLAVEQKTLANALWSQGVYNRAVDAIKARITALEAQIKERDQIKTGDYVFFVKVPGLNKTLLRVKSTTPVLLGDRGSIRREIIARSTDAYEAIQSTGTVSDFRKATLDEVTKYLERQNSKPLFRIGDYVTPILSALFFRDREWPYSGTVGRVEKINSRGGHHYIAVSGNPKEGYTCHESWWRAASRSQIEAHLLKEAAAWGFVKGAQIRRGFDYRLSTIRNVWVVATEIDRWDGIKPVPPYVCISWSHPLGDNCGPLRYDEWVVVAPPANTVCNQDLTVTLESLKKSPAWKELVRAVRDALDFGS